MTFKDHFSRRAAAYAAYRPAYPAALLAYVAALAPERRLAWDCATGSGQAALGLAEHFERVVATDASVAQVAHAARRAGVEYIVSRAEASGLRSACADLVTVAQALHWLDPGAFFAEARRVLVRGGAVAAWTYGDPRLEAPALDAVVQRFTHVTLESYWPPERRMIYEGYRSIPFPFAQAAAPPFWLECAWTLAELAGYLRTWSGTARYVDAHGADPVDALEDELRGLWGDPERRQTVRWPVTVRAGHAD